MVNYVGLPRLLSHRGEHSQGLDLLNGNRNEEITHHHELRTSCLSLDPVSLAGEGALQPCPLGLFCPPISLHRGDQDPPDTNLTRFPSASFLCQEKTAVGLGGFRSSPPGLPWRGGGQGGALGFP